MTIKEIIEKTNATLATPEKGLSATVEQCCVCDLLSWVMAKGMANSAWITVQTHMNVVAVASRLDMPAIILPDGILPEEDTVAKAAAEGIALICSPMNAFEICATLSRFGVKGV
jgi:hypothetical protein